MNNTTKTIAAFAGLALTAGTASAATSLTVISNAGSAPTLDTSGTMISAYNLGMGTNQNAANTPVTRNQGIDFMDIRTSGSHKTSDFAVDLTGYTNDVSGLSISTSSVSGPHFGSAAGLASDTLYGSFIYANGSGLDQTINIGNLSASTSYLVQIGFGDDRTAGYLDFDFSVFLNGADKGDIQWNTADSGADPYALATVLVSGETALAFELQSNNTIGPGISFVTVQSVPEPSTTALLGLGGLALIFRRRT